MTGIGESHAYIGTMIDPEVVHSKARAKMVDERSPGSTVVHHHGSNAVCKGREHTVYSHRDQKVTDKIYVDDGYAMWRQADPVVKR